MIDLHSLLSDISSNMQFACLDARDLPSLFAYLMILCADLGISSAMMERFSVEPLSICR